MIINIILLYLYLEMASNEENIATEMHQNNNLRDTSLGADEILIIGTKETHFPLNCKLLWIFIAIVYFYYISIIHSYRTQLQRYFTEIDHCRKKVCLWCRHYPVQQRQELTDEQIESRRARDRARYANMTPKYKQYVIVKMHVIWSPNRSRQRATSTKHGENCAAALYIKIQ